MISLRPLSWPQDRAPLLALDTSFTTDRIFRLERTDDRVELNEVAVSTQIEKSYDLASDVDAMPGYEWVQIAASGGRVVGVVAMRIQAWNRRAAVEHLYVAPEVRGKGVGHALLTATIGAARARAARCVWVETQTINYGAVRFYRGAGFSWCGFDRSLYDPVVVGVDEVALFFSRDL
jgi:ribosomal protein S18 acetylase RimI-like enzyme